MGKIDPTKGLEIEYRYNSQGESLKSLANSFGVSQPTISKFLRDRGNKIRSRGRAKKSRPTVQVTQQPVSEDSALERFKRKIVGL